MARKFLYVFAGLVALFIVGRIALAFWGNELGALAFVPRSPFTPAPRLAAGAYDSPAMWLSRPGATGAAAFRPEGAPADPAPLPAAVFYIHPTSFLDRAAWNGPATGEDDRTARTTDAFQRGIASAFNTSPQLYAPRYRQATFGAFLTDKPEGKAALDQAYRDIEDAFAAFVRAVPPGMPIVLAGHSQGAFHLKRLVAEHVAGTPIAARIVAVYAIGWPVSPAHDLPRMGMPACAAAETTGCVISWLSFAEPADTTTLRQGYRRFALLDGSRPGDEPVLCTNPLTGKAGGAAPATANLGTLRPDEGMTHATLVKGAVPAACAPDGTLHIGPPPEIGPLVLPGNNFHVYDVALFWANLRADVGRRTAAFLNKPRP